MSAEQVVADGGRTVLDKRVPIVLFADDWGGLGGTAGYVVMLGKELSRRGYQVSALCHQGPATQTMRSALEASGVRVFLIPAGNGTALFRQSRQLLGLVRLLKRHRGGVLALMMGYFTRGGGAILAGRIAGLAAIVRADLTPPEPPISRVASFSLRLKDRITDRVVVGAGENIDAFKAETGRAPARLRVIHTGVELGRFHPGLWRDQTRHELGYGPCDLVVGTVARLDDERKGIRDFIQAAGLLGAGTCRGRFLIVGDGVHREAYEGLARDLGVDSAVRFIGWRSDVPRLLDAMDIFVMASTYEGGPTSVLEAMAMAKATVSTRVGMVPEVIDPDMTGLIVPPSDPEALANAIGRLSSDEALRRDLGRRARDQAVSHLGIERMADDYLKLFASLLEKRSRKSAGER
jgi:glycosyltransferase involved in cell wall biosynthesis